jgi:hypothetical protein
LLPERTISAVNARETDLVMQLASQNSADRIDAKRRLKQQYLKEFKMFRDYSEAELREFSKLVRQIKRAFP